MPEQPTPTKRQRPNKSGANGKTRPKPMRINDALWDRFCEVVPQGQRTLETEKALEMYLLFRQQETQQQ